MLLEAKVVSDVIWGDEHGRSEPVAENMDPALAKIFKTNHKREVKGVVPLRGG